MSIKQKRSPLRVALGGLLSGIGLLTGVLAWEMSASDMPPVSASAGAADASGVERGAYLARAGNCLACHTARGGVPYAGGREITTPFGTLVSSNLTADPDTGLGTWSQDAFQRAMHEGISRDGRLLYPAFPYAHMTRMSEADVADLWAFVQTLKPVHHDAGEHRLRFPYKLQVSLALWRLVNFSPERHQADAGQSRAFNRGSYLVNGVAHCGACHTPRDAWGGARLDARLSGATMPGDKWLAPSLLDPAAAGVQDWPAADVVSLLAGGQAHDAVVMGPMAEVVFNGTQYLDEADLDAMAEYLQALPRQPTEALPFLLAPQDQMEIGQALYDKHCAACHGETGQGAPGAYPALAGNRTVTMASPLNLLQAILSGGFAPATKAHPRPYGMPPFRTLLNDREIAAVATFLRQSWEHQARPVSPQDVQAAR
ncbi:cytochrome c [Hydrogenophaga sp. 5NK40-0174]|uniref:cytochrome c n=1 Tax=Hydrogenophaga sp. 5NK40-0174 TaxID=3127649 RepID=UPI0031093240